MKRKFIHLMATIINETGINVIDKSLNVKFARYVLVVTPVMYAIFTLYMFSFTQRENFIEMISTAPYIGGGTIAVAGVVVIFCYRENVHQILYQMDDNIFTYSDEHLIVVNYEWYSNEKNGVSLYYLVMAAELFGYSMIASASIFQCVFTRQLTFYIFPSWTPWPETSIKWRFATLISQHIMTLCGLYLYYVGLLFIMIVTIEFHRQFRRLETAVKSLTSRTGTTVWTELNEQSPPPSFDHQDIYRDVNNLHTRFHLQFQTEFNRVFRKNVLNCVKHHQLLMKNHKLLQPLFGMVFSFELACCMMTLAVGLYCISVAANFNVILNLVGAAMIINVNFFARCYIGEHFSRECCEIKDTIFYESQWQDQSMENRLLLVIFHQQAQYSFDFFGFSIIKASLSAFASIMRSAYSLLNVIKAAVRQ